MNKRNFPKFSFQHDWACRTVWPVKNLSKVLNCMSAQQAKSRAGSILYPSRRRRQGFILQYENAFQFTIISMSTVSANSDIERWKIMKTEVSQNNYTLQFAKYSHRTSLNAGLVCGWLAWFPYDLLWGWSMYQRGGGEMVYHPPFLPPHGINNSSNNKQLSRFVILQHKLAFSPKLIKT